MKLILLSMLIVGNQISENMAFVSQVSDVVKSFFGTYESAPYKVINTYENDVEERLYPGQKWAVCESVVNPDQFREKQREMFFTMFSYISGNNMNDTKIAMTVPVSTKIEPLEDGKTRNEMGFYLPKEFQDNPPEPKNDQVNIVERDLHVYTKKFGGYASHEDYNTKAQELLAFLKEKEVEVVKDDYGKPIHYNVGYDAPNKFWNRRNEVWVMVK